MGAVAKIKEAIYRNSPPAIQDGLTSLYGWQLRSQRFGSEYRRQGEYLRSRKTEDPAWLRAEQDAELARLLNHCRAASEYYAPFLPDREIQPVEARSVLASLPMLTKDALRTHIVQVRTIEPRQGIVANTGGTTGASLQVVFCKADFQKRFAVLHEFQRQFGVDPLKDRKATFSGREIIPRKDSESHRPWRDNHAFAQRLYSTFHLHGAQLDLIVDDLEKFKPPIVNGFVSAISLVASRMLARGREPQWRPQAIFTTSETLTAHDRDIIERGFGIKVRDQYGSAEGSPVATECVHGRMHLNTYTGIVETVTVDGHEQACVTSFTNYGTPLLRYLIGDVLHFAEDEKCECGSAEPILDRIEGRKSDFLYASDGGKVSISHLSDVIKGIPNSVRRVKFVQHNIGALTMLVEADENRFAPDHLKKMQAAARYRFGDETRIEIEIVDHIPLAASGKFRMIENLVPQP